MRYFSGFAVVSLMLVLASAGCATSRLGNPFAATAARTGRAAKDRPDPSLADRGTRSRWQSKQNATDSKSAAEGNETRTGVAGLRRQAPTSNNDTAISNLIDEELRDAPAEDRQKMAADLKGLHPDMARQVLRAYKMGQRYHQQQIETAQLQRSSEYRNAPTQTASSNAAAKGNLRDGHSASLGNASAWGHTANYNAREPGTDSTAKPIDGPGHSRAGPLESTAGGVIQAGGIENVGGVVHAHVRDKDATESRVTQVGADAAPPVNSGGNPVSARNGAATSRFDRPAAGPDGSKAGLLGLGGLIPGVYNAGSKGVPPASQPPVAAGAVQRADYNANAPSGPSATSMQPVSVRAPTDASVPNPDNPWPVQLQAAIAAAEREVSFAPPGSNDAEKHAYIEKHVYLRMLYLMAGHQERALQAIPGIDAADQEFWQQTFWGLANYFDDTAIASAEGRATQTVSQLTTALLRLQEKAQLELRNVTFCHKIASFGNYERFPRDEFSPGQEVLLYSEVGNIHSESTTDGRFRTLLKSTLEIYQPGPQGTRIEQIELPAPATEDVCRTHRRDYFHSYQFAIPPKLASGPYVLKLTVEDQLSRRVASYSLNFTVK